MSDLKIKKAAGKVPLNLLPLRALKGVARVFGYGAKKYAAGNFLTASDDDIGNRYAGGLLRHLASAQRPDGLFDLASLTALDDESGLPEIDHAICGLIMLRALLVKRGALAEDPGEGRDPHIHTGRYSHDGSIEVTCGHGVAAGEGISVAIDPRDTVRQPVDVHTPHIFEEGDPRRVRPFCAPEEAAPGEGDPRRVRPFERPTGPGDPAPVKGPRFVVMAASDVPDGARAHAEGFDSEENAEGRAFDCNAGYDRAFRRDFRDCRWRFAVVDTRPEEG